MRGRCFVNWGYLRGRAKSVAKGNNPVTFGKWLIDCKMATRRLLNLEAVVEEVFRDLNDSNLADCEEEQL